MSTDRQRELLDLIDYADEGFSHYRKEFITIENMYHCVMDRDLKKVLDEAEKSSLYFNKSQAKSRRISDSLLKNYFSNDKFATILSKSDNTEMVDIAQAIEDETKDQLNTNQFFNAIVQGLYKVPYTGTLITRTYWNDGIVTENVNIDDFRFDPDAISQEDTRYVVHDIYVAIEDIKRMQREGTYSRKINIDELITEDEANSYTRVKLQEIYVRVGDDWKVSTVYDNAYFFRADVILKDGMPFSWGGLLPQTKKIEEENYIANYYEPPLASILNLQEEYNARRNQIIDAVKQSLNPKILVPKQSGLNPLDLKKPIGFIPVQDPSRIVVLPSADFRGGMQEIQTIDTEMSEISGVSPMMNGVSVTSNKTATQSGMEHSEGSLKLEIYTRHLNETYFEPLIKRIALLCWKYAPEDNFIGVNRQATPKLKISFNTGLGVVNDVIKTELLDKNFQRMATLLEMQMQIDPIKAKITLNGLTELVREGLSLSGIKNSDEYLGAKVELGELAEQAQQMPQMMQQEQMMQQQQEGM